MHSFGIFFLWALSASILWHGSFAKDQSGYICLIEDPKQNQCDSICLTELRPRLNEVVKAQNQGNTNTRDAVNDINSKLETLEVKIGEVQSKLEGQLQGVEAKLERQLQEALNKIENQLQALSKNIDSAKVEIPDLVRIAPFGFQRIGNRYFRIVNEYVDWDTAVKRCREMGGYLASFRSEEEFNTIMKKLERNKNYWLGINDQKNERHFVSVASQKSAPFLKWHVGCPTDRFHEMNCVYLYDGKMIDGLCKSSRHCFICQADNNT